MPLRYLSFLLGGPGSAAPLRPGEEAWSWRRRNPYSAAVALRHRDGSLVELRPLRARDGLQWRDGMPGLPIAGPAPERGPVGAAGARLRLERLVALDPGRQSAWAAAVREPDGWWGIGRGVVVGVRDEPAVAELAVAVHPEHRGRGVGRLLLRALAVSATVHGVERIRVWVAPDEAWVPSFVRGFGCAVSEEAGLYRCELPLAPLVASVCCSELTAELADLTRRTDGEAASRVPPAGSS